MEFTVRQIAELINGEVVGEPSAKISKFCKIEEGEQGGISFLANAKYEPFLYSSDSTAIIINSDLVLKKEVKANLILVENAYTAFTQLLNFYQNIIAQQKKGIEQPSFISSSASVGATVYIGAFSYIGENAKIGENVQIYPNCYVGDNVTIAENTILYAGVKIYHGCKIGANCVLHSGAVIGGDGFGFAPQADGSYLSIPQMGNVVLEDNVSIGSNTAIDRATMGSTIIRKGVKLDNLIQIAHNVEVGENTVMAAQSGIAGSTKLGARSQVGGQAAIAGHITLAEETRVGAQAGVLGNVKEKGTSLLGTFAIDFKDYIKSYAIFKQLPEMRKQLNDLEKKVNNIEL